MGRAAGKKKKPARGARVVKKTKKALAAKRGQGWLASLLGVSQQRVSKLVAREGWRWGKADWTDAQVVEIRAFVESLRAENNATAANTGETPVPLGAGDIVDPRELLKLVDSPKDRIKLIAIVERAAKVQLDRELLLGGFVKKDIVEAERIARVQAVRAELGNIRLLAIRLEGRTAREIETELENWAQDVCRTFEQKAS